MLRRFLSLNLLLVIPFFAFTQVDLTKGLVAYYPFNGNANDVSGNGNNPIFNNATLTKDYYGNSNSAYHFNGVDNYMEIPNNASLNPTNISICAWIKPTGFYYGPCHGNSVVMKGNADFQSGNYMIRYDDALYTGTNCNGGPPDTLHETYYAIGTGLSPVQDTPYAQKNIWRSVVYTYDGSHARLYIDCNLILDSEQPGLSFANGADLFFGRLNDSQYPYWLNADLDEVRIYNRALNEDEVKAYSSSCKQLNKVTASFTSPDTICVNAPVNFLNTSQNANNYYWNFCAANFNTTPVGSNLGNPGNLLSAPVFMDYILDDNGNYYGFVSNYNGGHLIRLNYGKSLLNNPTAEDLGNLGAIPPYAEGIQVKKFNGKCYVFVVSAGNAFGTNSQLIKIDFGNSFSNSPFAISLGNIGGLSFPHDLFITEDNNNFYGFTVNINDNTITRFDFGNDLSNQPTGTNLGNIGNLDYPCGFSFVNSNGIWYAFITNRNSNSITRLKFGSSLSKVPTGINIGDPGNFLNRPRDISIFQSCDGVVGLVVNEEDEQTGTITKLDFRSDITSTPSAKNLGNIGNITFPHSISKFFLEGNDIYSFIPNVTTSTLTRIRYVGCNNSSIPSSTQQTPPPVTYSQPGVYNINLLVDIGLPTETSFCKQIVVKDCNNPCDSFKVNAGKDIKICYGSSIQLNATGATTYDWNSSTALSDTTIANPIAKPLTTTQFIVTGYSTDSVCSDKDTVRVSVLPLPVFTINNDTSICNGNHVNLNANSNNNYHYHWMPRTYLSDTSIANPIANPADTIKYFVIATDSSGCTSTDSVQINVVPKPIVSTINDTSICFGTTVLLSTIATNANKFSWNPSSYLNSNSIQSPQASPVSSILYRITASNSLCSSKDYVQVTVLSLPNVSAGNDTIICSEGAARLRATGAINYNWHPAKTLSDSAIPNPIAFPSSNTIYYVTGTDQNNCINTDSVTVFKQNDPVFSVNPTDSSICLGKTISLKAAGGDTYTWLPSQSLSNPSSANTSATPLVTTNYSVLIYDSTCRTSKTLNSVITVKPSPNITISKSNDIDCSNLQAQLNATGGDSYSWTPATNIDNTQIANPVVNPTSDTKYTVTVSDSDNCIASASVLVKSTLGDMGFYVASAFTPNGDGLNDCFGVHYWGVSASFDMMIYDKWGVPVYHSNNIGECWDGTYKGKKQGSGTYVYMITATSVCGTAKVFRKGTVVLIR